MKKKLLIFLAILIFVPGAGTLFVAVAVDPMTRAGFVKGSSEALKVETRLDVARVRFNGSVHLEKFEIANPPGFHEPHAATVPQLDGSIKFLSLISDTVEGGEVTVLKPELTLEYVGLKSNWDHLVENLRQGKDEKGKRFKIAKLRVESGSVRIKSNLVPGGARVIPVPTFEVKDVGEKSMAELLLLIFQSMITEAIKP